VNWVHSLGLVEASSLSDWERFTARSLSRVFECRADDLGRLLSIPSRRTYSAGVNAWRKVDSTVLRLKDL